MLYVLAVWIKGLRLGRLGSNVKPTLVRSAVSRLSRYGSGGHLSLEGLSPEVSGLPKLWLA